ncbi:positive regulator of sigma(E), RseC/MucC [Natronincola peptidivorans]|uniref:Positive regulator of sigma(E), RseC/MucC n=1 Tax=Natronincola peptidivorans TaxID=426128 RepID=A0A1H9YVM4_9FIRM|nr:SoxR reducing system RseC family protein [Natronincola peptidivorans]SES73254.1 positive regulator of sigma(E), RseC/MucC [Natronincola peptidivorans]
MRQCGVVTETNNKTAKVIIQRHSSCGSCNACKMGQENMKIEIDAINEINAKVGQRVEVDMEGRNVLTAAFIIYVIPLAALIVGILVSSAILPNIGIENNTEIYIALIGFVFMALSFIGIRKRENRLRENKKFVPIITEIAVNQEKI